MVDLKKKRFSNDGERIRPINIHKMTFETRFSIVVYKCDPNFGGDHLNFATMIYLSCRRSPVGRRRRLELAMRPRPLQMPLWMPATLRKD